MAVEVLASSVIDRCRAGVGVAGGELHVTQRNTGIERGHTESSTKHVGVDVSEACVFADRSDPPVRGAPVESGTFTTYQDWSIASFSDGQVDVPGGSSDERDHRRLVAFADDAQCPVASVEAKVIDVGVACFADAKPV